MSNDIGPGMKFAFSSLSGCLATVVVQPMDLVKNRVQMDGEGGTARSHSSTFGAVSSIYKKEGFKGFYNGLGAGILRQIMYTGTRLGIYTSLFSKFSHDGKPPAFFTKIGIASVAGSVGAFVGTPAEVCLIRMTTDKKRPVAEQRNYKNVFDAITRIVKEEGVLTLWRGCGPTISRAVVVNIAQLVSYSQAKQSLLSTQYFNEGLFTHFTASMISALITTFFSLPVDIAKTRLQQMKYINGKPEYSGFRDVFGRIYRNEGVSAFWKGFLPYYARLGPHTVLTFIFVEQFLTRYKTFKGIENKSGSL